MIDPDCARRACARRLGKSQLSSALVIVMMAGLVWLAVTKMNIGAASAALAHASMLWVTIAIFSVAAAFLCRAESWHVAVRAALPQNRQVRRGVVARSLIVGVAASTVAPARVGEGVRTWMLSRRTGGCCATILGTVVAQTFLNLLALALLAVVTLTAGGHGFHTQTIAIAILVPIVLLLALVVVSRLLSHRLPSRAPGRDAGIGRRVGYWFSRQVSGTGRGMAVFSSPTRAVHSGGAQLGAWMFQCFACFSVLLALGLHANVGTAAAILLAINLSAIVPVTPGNVGLFQAACIAVLTPLGISGAHALAYGLLLQGVEMSVAVGLGIPALMREGLSLRELGRAVGGREPMVVVAAG